MPRAGLTAARLTEAAADLADEVGLDQVTFSALARRFGVKDASLYSHVRGVRALRVRIALLASREMAERIGAAVAGRARRDALLAFAAAYRAYGLAHPGRYAALQLRIEPDELAQAPAEPGWDGCVPLTYGLLRGYGLEEPAATDAGRLLRATFHGYVHLEAGGGFGAARPVHDSWEAGIEALHLVLQNWPDRRDRPSPPSRPVTG